mgnify:CR=1 FL=1
MKLFGRGNRKRREEPRIKLPPFCSAHTVPSLTIVKDWTPEATVVHWLAPETSRCN